MGLARKVLKGFGKRAADKVMDRVGGRLVSGMADTSADAPSAFHQPKRDLYRHIVEGSADGSVRGARPGLAQPPKVQPAEGEPEADAAPHDHDHDHDHES